jgi:hypothetical protein
MAASELVEYLREHLGLGYGIDELKLQLVRYGHPAVAVNEAVEAVKKEALDSLPSPGVPLRMQSSANAWLFAPALLFVLLFSIGVIVAILRSSAV